MGPESKYKFLTVSHLPIPSSSSLTTFPLFSLLPLYQPPSYFWIHYANTCFKVPTLAILLPGIYLPLMHTWRLPGSLHDCFLQKSPSKWGLYWFKFAIHHNLHPTLPIPLTMLYLFFSTWHSSPSYMLYNWLIRIIIVSPHNHLRM